MICPNCGFNQPDDLDFCAKCGVNVKEYARKKRKKRALQLLMVLCLAGIILAFSFFIQKPDKKTPPFQQKSPSSVSQKPAPPELLVRRSPRPKQAKSGPAVEHKPKSDSFVPALAGPLSPPGNKEPEKKTRITAPSAEETAKTPETLTAKDWFEKGLALDDDSEEEIHCYLEALKLNPKFAPAHYRLGAIYFRQADYDTADQHFLKFLRFASKEDKDLYDIHVFYSPEEVEDMLLYQDKPGRESEEEETKASAEKSEEVKTAIPYTSFKNHVLVNVILNESLHELMLLDTGAGMTLLSAQTAKKLGLINVDQGKFVTLRVLDRDIKARTSRLSSIKIAGIEKKDFPVAIYPIRLGNKGPKGILGMDFLKGLDFHIDSQNHKLYISLSPN